DDSRVAVRAALFALVTWLPLVILGALQGLALNDVPRRSVLLDYTLYGRYLIALPLFVLAENVVDDRFVIISSYFFNSGVVPDNQRDRFLQILSSTHHLVLSRTAEIVTILAAYVIAGLTVFGDIFARTATWGQTDSGAISYAGLWLLIISLPFFTFFIL